LFAWCVRLSRL